MALSKKFFLQLQNLDDRVFEINTKDLISSRLREFLSFIPTSLSAHYLIEGHKFQSQGNYLEAIKSYSQVSNDASENSAATYLKGICYYKLMDFENAIVNFNVVLFTRIDISEVCLYRANSALAISSYHCLKVAIDDYSLLINREFFTEWSYYSRGLCYFLLRNNSLAFLDHEKARMMGFIPHRNEKDWKTDYQFYCK